MTTARRGLDRRSFLGAAGVAALGAGVAALSSSSASAATVIPDAVDKSTARGTAYKDARYDRGGDIIRLLVPNSALGASSVGLVWLFHGATSGADNAIENGFAYPASLILDAGAPVICVDAAGGIAPSRSGVAGDGYTNARAQRQIVEAYAFIRRFLPVNRIALRSTSAGGAMGVMTYARKLVPNIRGHYMVNGAYDLEQLERRSGTEGSKILAAFSGNRTEMAKQNPARVPAQMWAGTQNVVVVAANGNDPIVDTSRNGEALAALVQQGGGNAIVRTHTDTDGQYLGHTTPSFTHREALEYYREWGIL